MLKSKLLLDYFKRFLFLLLVHKSLFFEIYIYFKIFNIFTNKLISVETTKGSIVYAHVMW